MVYFRVEERNETRYQIAFQHILLIVAALSYCWGEEHDTTKARVMPTLAGKITTLFIRLNLANALKHLRQATGSRVLWIDAICIDQLNISERNHEVQRMGNIYKLAQRVVVWLGPANEESTRGLELLAALGQILVRTTDNYLCNAPLANSLKYSNNSSEAVQNKLKRFSLGQTVPYNAGDYQAISDILHRHWWNRLW
jgi:hypothetical protein